ncbi:aldo-keto reductase 1B-like isoform X1 [Mytilus edulis]|uniref:aldo-keto reductase 1B-like isoform X1 n=1 Tax=Mytilus edulis TaxID=6550 RepID=UPI0039EE1874
MANKFSFTLNSGSVMPALGFGTYAPQHVEDDVLKAVRIAVKAGYRHLDCAAIYRNERAVGQALKQLIVESTITRKDIFVTSKLWNTCHRPDLVRSSLKKSLDDLGLTYLDLYLVHWPMGYQEGGEFIPRGKDGNVLYSDVDFVETWKALEDCVDEGLVKDIGLSNFNSKQIERLLEVARIKPSNNQVECHLHLAQNKLIEYCKSKNITVTAYSPLGSPGNKSAPHTPALEEPVVKQLASQKNKTPAQILLRFLLQRGLAVIPKSVTQVRITENFQVFDFELSEDEMTQLTNLNKDHRLSTEDIALKHKYYPFNEEF